MKPPDCAHMAEDSVLGNLRAAIRSHFFPRRHTVMLAAIVTAFSVRPVLGDAGNGPLVFSLAMLALMLVSLYTIQIDDLIGDRRTLLAERRRHSIIGWGLSLPAFADRLIVIFAPRHSLYLIGSMIWFLLFAFITWNEFARSAQAKGGHGGNHQLVNLNLFDDGIDVGPFLHCTS